MQIYRRTGRFHAGASWALAGMLSLGSGMAVAADAAIEEGSTVTLEYTLKLEDGSVADTNKGQDPLVYTQGGNQILPALEDAMVGLKASETKQITIEPGKAYGSVDPEAFIEVAAEVIPEESRTIGAMLMARSEEGQERVVRVHEIKADKIVLDYNHPLAGKTLYFDIQVLKVE